MHTAPEKTKSREEKIRSYKELIERLTPPKTYTDRLLLQIYRDMLDRYKNPAAS